MSVSVEGPPLASVSTDAAAAMASSASEPEAAVWQPASPSPAATNSEAMP